MAASRTILLCLVVITTAAAVAATAPAVSVQVGPNALPTVVAQPGPHKTPETAQAALGSRKLQQSAGKPGQRAADSAGGKGVEREARKATKRRWIYVHAVLMSLAWVGLLPLGILIAQSRWAKPLKQPVVGKNVWFWIHMALNISGVALAIAAFAIATSASSHMNIKAHDGPVALAHKALGSTTFGLLLLQVVAAFIRPHPGQSLRGAWNAVHNNLGRLVILVAWAVIWLGVAIGFKDLPGSLARWVAPLAAAQGVILLAYLTNQALKKRNLDHQHTQEKKQHTLADMTTTASW